MGSERKPVIYAKGLYKIYRVGETQVRALNGVDLSIYPGEFCAIVGTSGSGKSTLLNMLAGLEKPTKGEIAIGRCRLDQMNENQLVRFRREAVGFIFQSFNLIPSMNALENVALPLSFRGVPKKIRLARAARLLKTVGLAEHLFHKPSQMSGGQQQRVGVARALVVDPAIIFADEPTGNLDSKTTVEIMEMICTFARDYHQTIILVTHDPEMAAYADRIVTLIDGEIVSNQVNKKECT